MRVLRVGEKNNNSRQSLLHGGFYSSPGGFTLSYIKLLRRRIEDKQLVILVSGINLSRIENIL